MLMNRVLTVTFILSPPLYPSMQKTAIIAIAVVAVLAIGGGAGFLIYKALNKDTSETDSTIVGHEFEYRVVGNYEDKLLGGTQKVTILTEDDTRYEVRTVRNIYSETELGTRTTLYDDTNTEWKIKDDITKPGKFVKDSKMNTYWGEKDTKVYTKTESTVTTTWNVAYGAISFETTVEDGDNLFIYMLKNSDYMKKSKVDEPRDMKLSLAITGTYSSSLVSGNITGNMSSERLDATGTASMSKNTMKMTMETMTIVDKTETKWSLREASDSGSGDSEYGTKTGTATVSTTWGSLETDVYSKSDAEGTTTTYVYRDVLPIKIVQSGTTATYTMELSMIFDSFTYDGKEIKSKADLDSLIDKESVKL